MVGEKVSSKKNIYVSEKNAVLKISSNKKSDEYGYATTLNGNITKINGNTLDVTATENGSYIYVYILNKDGKYEKNYTAVNLILIELEDKTIYVGEGKTVNIDNIGKVNSDNLKFENIKDSSIIKIDNNTITGLKAGETSFTAKEKNTNATSLVTVKVVKLEFEKDYGTVLLGSSKSVKLTGINNGAVSVRTSDNKIATVSLVDNQVIITPKSVGNVDLTISETNANTSDTYKLKVANVILSPNGGEYVLPTNSTVATVKTLVKVENANSIETSWSDNLTKWEEIVNNKEIIRNDLSLGKYNLCVRIDGEEIYKSKEFVISENENTNSKIIITPDKVGWSNSDVTATVTYGSILTENRKGGFGNTLASAKAAANSKNATTIVANETGYFYAEATDTAGNKVTASLQVYIDKIAPTVPTVTAKLNDVNGTAYTAGTWTANSVYVELSSTDTQSGVKSYQWYNNGWTTSGLTTANGKGTITFKDSINQVIRFRTIDNVGNVSAESTLDLKIDKTAPTAPTVTSKLNNASGTTYTSGTWTNQNVYVELASTDAGSGIKEYQWYRSNAWSTSELTTTNGKGSILFDVQRNETLRFRTVDNMGNISAESTLEVKMDKTLPTVTLSQNGGTYAIPTGASKATIKTRLTAGDTGGSNLKTLQYAWSTSNTTAPTSWTNFTNGAEVSKTDAVAGTYYLWTNVTDASGNVASNVRTSAGFVVKNNDNTGKITISPDKTGWTNTDVIGTVTYGSTLTAGKKAGFGTTLDAAKTAAATSTAASVTATENGYFYAEATDAGGNKVTTSLQITTIDKIAPDATFAGSFSRSDLYVNSYVNISVACSDKGGSGLNYERSRFYIDNKGTTDVNVVDGTDKITNTYQSLNVKTPSTAGTYYVHVIVEDNAGNVKTLTSSAIEVKGMKIGNYVKYNLSYKDMISGYTFTENNGWRILDLSDSKVVKLVSTGVPVKFNYSSSNIKSSSSWSSLDTNQYEDKFYASGDSNLYAATGLYFNFENIKFGSSSNAFMYGSVINGNNIYSGDGSIFKTNGATSVRALTLSEINHARNFAKKLALNEDPVNPRYNNTFYTDITTENDAAKGLFKLNDLGTYSYSASTNAEYMVASPYYRRLTGSSDIETALIYINNESVSNYTNSGMYGLRVVVEIPKDQFDLEIEP